MKFTSVSIKNFYNLEEVDLDLTEGNALIVGPNGSGKSNIIKCINFLVNGVSRHRQRYMFNDAVKIWNANAAECFIQVNATLSKAELEQFSTLRICHLLLQVCKVVTMIVAMLQKLAVNHWPNKNEERTQTQEEYEDWVKFIRTRDVFKDLPEEAFDVVFKMGSLANLSNGKVSLVADSERRLDYCIEKTINELFPELLKFTKDSIKSGGSRPKEGTDVKIKLEIGDTGSEIDRSISILDDVWLPVTPEIETQAVWTTVQNLFGSLDGINFVIEEVDSTDLVRASRGRKAEIRNENRPKTGVPLKTMISQLVAQKHWHRTKLQFSCTQRSITQPDVTTRPPEDNLFPMMMKDRCFSRWLSNCWQGPHDVQGFFFSEWLFPDMVAKHFLKSSLCILQQNRGLLTTEDIVSLDANKVEKLLIESCLSQKKKKREQYDDVADALKKFCSLDIHVCRKQFHDLRTEPRRHTLSQLALDCGVPFLSDFMDDFDAENIEQRRPPHWTEGLQVLVTRNLKTNGSPYSIQTTLSDLSGGEIEILMCLCAIHLSGADTVILDEPGHSLHPPQQAQLRRWLETQRPQDQVCVVVTHSTEFITPQSLKCLYHMSFEGSGFKPFRLRLSSEPQSSSRRDAPRSQVTFTQETLTMLMRPDMRKMFFATGLYLVEGETDKRVFSAVRHLMMEEARKEKESKRDRPQTMTVAEMDRWNILALQGCAEAVRACKAATELKIPHAVVLDLDAITVTKDKKTLPSTLENWKKSRLHKQLVDEKDSLEVAKTLLEKIEEAFQESPEKALGVFQQHGFWIWKEGNLEAAICDDQAAKPKLLDMEDFINVIEIRNTFKMDACRQEMHAQQAAQRNFKDNVMPELSKIVSEIQAKLSAVPDMMTQNPTESVTGELQQLFRRLDQRRGLLEKHDSDFQNRNRDSTISEDDEKEFWRNVKKKLHKGGWARMSWDTLQEVVKTCLQSKTSPLSKFRDFMKDWQSNGH